MLFVYGWLVILALTWYQLMVSILCFSEHPVRTVPYTLAASLPFSRKCLPRMTPTRQIINSYVAFITACHYSGTTAYSTERDLLFFLHPDSANIVSFLMN